MSWDICVQDIPWEKRTFTIENRKPTRKVTCWPLKGVDVCELSNSMPRLKPLLPEKITWSCSNNLAPWRCVPFLAAGGREAPREHWEMRWPGQNCSMALTKGLMTCTWFAHVSSMVSYLFEHSVILHRDMVWLKTRRSMSKGAPGVPKLDTRWQRHAVGVEVLRHAAAFSYWIISSQVVQAPAQYVHNQTNSTVMRLCHISLCMIPLT